jgi:hypothetical protein
MYFWFAGANHNEYTKYEVSVGRRGAGIFSFALF